jgi:hypothetical protein
MATGRDGHAVKAIVTVLIAAVVFGPIVVAAEASCGP